MRNVFRSFFRSHYRLYCQLKDFPGPPIGSFLKGNLDVYWDILASGKPASKTFHGRLTELCKIYGREHGFFRLWFGPFVPMVVICDGRLAKRILSSPAHTDKATIYRLVDHFAVGKSIFTSSAEIARQERKWMQPFYSLNYLNWYTQNTSRNLQNLAEKVEECVQKNDGLYKNVDLLVSTYVYDSVAENIFSSKFESIKSAQIPPYIPGVHGLFSRTGAARLQPWRYTLTDNRYLFFFINAFNTHFFSMSLPALPPFISFYWAVFRIIYRRYRELSRSQMTELLRKDGSSSQKLSQLDWVLIDKVLSQPTWSLSRLLGWNEVLRFGLLFVVAGHDTTTSTICWTLYLLAHYPEAQQKAREEVEQYIEGLSAKDETPNAINLKKLPYTEAAIKEALRLYPVAQFLGRSGDQPFVINEQFTIPQSVDLFIFKTFTNHQEKYFRDPLNFRPERYLTSEEESTTTNAVSFPFGLGERICLGKQYSMQQMKLFFTTLLPRFHFRPVDRLGDIENDYHFLRLPPNFDLKVEQRY